MKDEQRKSDRIGPIIVAILFLLFAAETGVLAQENSQPKQPSREKTEAHDQNSDIAKRPLPEKIQANPEASDEEIQSRLMEILAASEWYKDVSVTADDGIVVLEGRTGKEEHKLWATGLAQRTQNVVAVINHMQVGATVDFSRSWNIVLVSLRTLWQDFLGHLPLLSVGLIVLVFTYGAVHLAQAVARNVLSRSRLRSSLQDLFLQLTSLSVWILGITVAAVIVFPGMTPAKLLTVLGLSSVAIGFAFKDIFENFFAGVLILWRFPFDKGDFVECGDLFGRVEDITVRNTLIRQVDGQLVVVPNAMLFKNPVSVLTNWKSRRVSITCGIAYGEDVEQARDEIKAAVAACETVHQDREIEIFASEFGSSSIDFEVTWWTGNKPKDIRQSRDEVIEAVKKRLDDAGIEIPFPYRTLTFKEALPLAEQPLS